MTVDDEGYEVVDDLTKSCCLALAVFESSPPEISSVC